MTDSANNRKVDANNSEVQGSYKVPRIGDEDCQHQAGLQNASEDVVNNIIEFLKLSVKSLVAFSLTCSGWFNRIRSAFDKDIQNYYPLSYKNYTGQQRLSELEDYYFLQSESLDLQHFEFQTSTTGNGPIDNTIHPVPWAPHIIFFHSCLTYGIFDLNKKEVILPFGDPLTDCPFTALPVCTMNKRRKQVVIASTELELGEREEDNRYNAWLNVYNVDDKGTVEFVTKFKSNDALVEDTEETWLIAPILLDDFGITDDTANCRTKKFSIDANEEIPFEYALKHTIVGIGERHNKILLFCADFNHPNKWIAVFDTSTQRIIGYLPQSLETENQKVIIMNNFAVYVHRGYNTVECVFDLDQFKCLFRYQDMGSIQHTDENSPFYQLDTSIGRRFATYEVHRINEYLSSNERDYCAVKSKKYSDDYELPRLSRLYVGPGRASHVENILFWVTEDRSNGSLKISRVKINRPVM